MPNGICPRCKTRRLSRKNAGYCRECVKAVSRARTEKRKALFLSGDLQHPTEKQCRRCRKVKNAGRFSVHYRIGDGLSNWCKECTSEHCTKTNKRRKYGMDDSAIVAMLSSQGNACAICLRQITFGERKNNFHIDHDHQTGSVRGILCETCNPGLGKLGDDPARIAMAIAYLKRTMSLNRRNSGGKAEDRAAGSGFPAVPRRGRQLRLPGI
jgi:hypothetical protein